MFPIEIFRFSFKIHGPIVVTNEPRSQRTIENQKQLKQAPEICPICGADVPAKAKACPECGADHETGWSEDAYASGLGLPEDNFDYDDFVKKEFGAKQQVKPHGLAWVWWVLGIALVIGLILASIGVFR
jgi:hypothetical protein